jgi:hypothetical protein
MAATFNMDCHVCTAYYSKNSVTINHYEMRGGDYDRVYTGRDNCGT